MLKKSMFRIRNANQNDLKQLVELEEQWPENSRATEEQLKIRLEKFAPGFFVAEDDDSLLASIISFPYHYQHNDLSNFKNWTEVVNHCYATTNDINQTNALYIVSGTTKKTPHVTKLFNGGVNHVVELAKSMGKSYVVGGALLPGYARYLEKNNTISAEDYVFKQLQQRFVDPLIEKYRRVGFSVPDKNHVIANYFPDAASLNYSALVVKSLL